MELARSGEALPAAGAVSEANAAGAAGRAGAVDAAGRSAAGRNERKKLGSEAYSVS